MATVADVKAKLGTRNKFTYSNSTKVRQEMNKLVWSYLSNENPPTAYCTRNGKADQYWVAVNKDAGIAREVFEIHEFGHCIYQHLKLEKTSAEQVDRQIVKNWEKFKTGISLTGNETPEELEEIRKNFIPMLKNLAMDMEVNSRIFPGKEKDEANADLEYFQINQTLKEAEEVGDQSTIDHINEYLDEKAAGKNDKPFAKMVFPEDYKFPNGLNWRAYMRLILKRPEEFMDKMNNNLTEQDQMQGNSMPQSQGGQGQGSGSQGQNNGQSGKGNGNGSGSGGNKKGKGSSGGGNKITPKGVKEKAKQSDVSGENQNKGDSQPVIPSGGKGSGVGSNHLDGDFLSAAAAAKLEGRDRIKKFIHDNCIGLKKFESRPDYFHNYNRHKCGDVMMPKMKEHELHREGNAFCLIDVSGSVDKELVCGIVKELKKDRTNFGHNSRVILWDTSLCGDYSLFDPELDRKIRSGGGTSMARGIHYIKENYVKGPSDKIFVISDFYDDLEEWMREVKASSCEAYGICWGGYDGEKAIKEVASNYPELEGAANSFKVLQV